MFMHLFFSAAMQGVVELQKEKREKGLTRNEAVFNLRNNFAEELKEDLVVPMSLMMCKKCFSAFES